MTITAEQLVCREVFYCVSSLVHTLASDYGAMKDDTDCAVLSEQAFYLSTPIEDWDEAVNEAGWVFDTENDIWHLKDDGLTFTGSAQELAEAVNIEPYQREVFEHWIVSDWLAEKLEAKGEKVDKDFAGMTIWARTTTGQGIASDWVIEQIVKEMGQ